MNNANVPAPVAATKAVVLWIVEAPKGHEYEQYVGFSRVSVEACGAEDAEAVEYRALPAADFDKMAANERMFLCLLDALGSAHNRALPFAQVMADLGCDKPAGDPVEIRIIGDNP